MCLTHVYQCNTCQKCFPIPLVRRPLLSARRLIEWIQRDSHVRPNLVDHPCDNRYCMRRNEGGYSVCLFMNDPCYFCIRFGNPASCQPLYVPFVCRSCYEKKNPEESLPYPSQSPHLRTVRGPDNHKNPRRVAAHQAMRELNQHSQGQLELSEANLLVNAALVSETHL